jgi:hypothetical protein
VTPETDIEFTITVAAAEGCLIVTLRFSIEADREEIEACMGDIACAFNAVEPLTEIELQGLYWQQERVSEFEDSVQLRKAFSDPTYPERFEAALKAANYSIAGRALH